MTANLFNPTVTTKDAKSGYASVNGINLYYEIHGTGNHWSWCMAAWA